jgi:hypothetical protein
MLELASALAKNLVKRSGPVPEPAACAKKRTERSSGIYANGSHQKLSRNRPAAVRRRGASAASFPWQVDPETTARPAATGPGRVAESSPSQAAIAGTPQAHYINFRVF